MRPARLASGPTLNAPLNSTPDLSAGRPTEHRRPVERDEQQAARRPRVDPGSLGQAASISSSVTSEHASAPGMTFRGLGVVELKGIREPLRLYHATRDTRVS
jgi:hypothetical protein